MTELKRGDVCSLEVVVDGVCPVGNVAVAYKDFEWIDVPSYVNPSALTLIRRAPVDLATCDLSEPVRVVDKHGRDWLMVHRHEHLAAVVAPPPAGGQIWEKISNLRPADAPAPASGELRSILERLDDLSPDEEIGVTDGHGQWIALATVGGFREFARRMRDAPAPAAEAVANARLIAAAPELLEALKALFASYKELADSGDAGFWSIEDTPEGKKTLAAIAKAEGQP